MDITEKVLGKNYDKIITIKEFCNTHHNGVTPQAIDYAINKDSIDYIQIGRFRYVVLNEKTLRYTPNANSKRTTISFDGGDS